ncbi:MAG: HAMP domain-containing sensor histidine kinase [Coleofasciculaceae cyanobacterium]
MKVVDIHEEIDSTLVLLQNSLKAKQNYSAIKFIKLYSQLPKVECYAGEFKQALMNILTNAVEACDQHNLKVNLEATLPQSAKIWIRTTRQESGAIAISIKDNGTGITPWVEQHLFDPFFSTKSTTQNIGFGLSVSYQIIVERHGGKLNCVSSVEQGAEFVIELSPQAIQEAELTV